MESLLAFWGKTTSDGTSRYHPVLFHMLDVARVAQALLADPATPRWRTVLSMSLGASAEGLGEWLPYWVALHDIGKVSSAFQGAEPGQHARLAEMGVPFGERQLLAGLHHTVLGQVFLRGEWLRLEQAGLWEELLCSVCNDMIGGHHGRFAGPGEARWAIGSVTKLEPAEWREWRAQVAQALGSVLSPHPPDGYAGPAHVSAAVMTMTGFAILCDWIGSDSAFFPAQPGMELDEYLKESAGNAERACRAAGMFQKVASDAPAEFSRLFLGISTPRPLQIAIDAIPSEILGRPCLAIIEAPTGEGKTEAALALAHRLAQASGTDEFYCALPTTATSNQMFSRLQLHLRDRLGLQTQAKLVHGQAFLVEDDLRVAALDGGDASDLRALQEWFGPLKRALLAPFGVGTIDQVELAALNVRYGTLRLVGLAGKVVILDEVHAYDTYMTTIVERLLAWLAALGSSVILLSATLPTVRRAALARAYGCTRMPAQEEEGAYPSLWLSNAAESYCATPAAYQPRRELELHRLSLGEDDVEGKARWLVEAVAEGGCACWMCNTVGRAQRIYAVLSDLAPPGTHLALLHSRFPQEDKQRLEQSITSRYGPAPGLRPERGIVVGTQVLEQSLDLDFDVLVTDLAPVDFLLQRAGRLHRHRRERPRAHTRPRLWIAAPTEGAGELELGADRFVYDEYILRQTWRTLAGRTLITLPADYRVLVEAVYDAPSPEPGSALFEAWTKLQKIEADAAKKAAQRLVPAPHAGRSFCGEAGGWLFEEDEGRAAWFVAQTRLGEESVSVIPLERGGMRAWVAPGEEIALGQAASRELQLRLLKRSLRVSQRDVVQALREADDDLPRLFSESPLLRGHLPLWLTDGCAVIRTRSGCAWLKLNPELGLVIEREGR